MENEPAVLHWFRLFSIIYLSILSVATTLLNGFTLFVIFKDPLKCFRTPLTIFITGIIASDFIIGLVGEPILAVSRASDSVDTRVVISTSVDASFLIMLALAVAQLQAVRKPEVYQRWFTNCSARVIIVCIWIYALVFALIPVLIDVEVSIYALNIFLNVLVIAIFLIVISVITYKLFKKSLVLNDEQTAERGMQQNQAMIEKEFLKGTLILVVLLIIAVLPLLINAILRIAELLVDDHHSSLRIFGIIYMDFLFLKFLLDPLVFIFRVPKYRRAVRLVCGAKCGCVEDERGDNAPAVVYDQDDGTALFTEITLVEKMVNEV